MKLLYMEGARLADLRDDFLPDVHPRVFGLKKPFMWKWSVQYIMAWGGGWDEGGLGRKD